MRDSIACRALSVAFVTLAITFTGCATLDPDVNADALAARGGLQRQIVDTHRFALTTFSRVSRPDKPLRIYIEGDGLAWLSRTEPSRNPTPRHAEGLALAAEDAAPNVVYLARPCQFTPMAGDPSCAIPYWTGKRFAPEVVESMNEAVSHFAAMARGQAVELVGYSGGGAIAVLIAAQRRDVASIRTVAGNLDDEYVNQLHGVSPMPQSQNAIDFARDVASIPQVHFSGAEDTIVPPSVAKRFVAATGATCAQALTVPVGSHEDGWTERWPALLDIAPVCGDMASGH
ncbi:alpha/beta fold hydrolase [Paraburkholderia dipogonis]|nr:alpha/beta hydrolase [Paraburkholderia dipogonis]